MVLIWQATRTVIKAKLLPNVVCITDTSPLLWNMSLLASGKQGLCITSKFANMTLRLTGFPFALQICCCWRLQSKKFSILKRDQSLVWTYRVTLRIFFWLCINGAVLKLADSNKITVSDWCWLELSDSRAPVSLQIKVLLDRPEQLNGCSYDRCFSVPSSLLSFTAEQLMGSM